MGVRYCKGVWEGHVHTAMFKMHNQQGPTVEHTELCPVLCGSRDGRGFRGERIPVHVGLSSFTAYLKLAQHCQSLYPSAK